MSQPGPEVQAAALAARLAPKVPQLARRVVERIRADTGTSFITVLAPDRTRYTHPDPAEIGRPFRGTIAPALAGQTFTETYTGTLGPSVRAVVIFDGEAKGSTEHTLADVTSKGALVIASSPMLPEWT